MRILRTGADAWNAWRALHPDTYFSLSDRKIRDMKLPGVNLTGAYLQNTEFHDVDLQGADLSGADLYGTKFLDSQLNGVNFAGSQFFQSHFVNVQLNGANFTEAEMVSVEFADVDLWDAKFCRAKISNCQFLSVGIINADLSDARFQDVHFSDANLTDTDFKGAEFKQAAFTATNLAAVKNLDTCKHSGPSAIDFPTLKVSGPLPPSFLRGCGFPDSVIRYLNSSFSREQDFYSCFISYSHADQAFAVRLYKRLQARGVRCWLDKHELEPGDDLHDKIQQGIRRWDKTLLCCSRAAMTSWWVDNEIKIAFAKEEELMKQHKRQVLALIPLDLDGYLFTGQWRNGKSVEVRSRLAADFTGWETSQTKFNAAFKHLMKAMRANEDLEVTAPTSQLGGK